MVTRWRKHGFAYLALFEGEGCVFKLFQRLTFLQPRQFATLLRRTFIVRQFTSQSSEVGPAFKGIINGVDALFGAALQVFGRLLGQQQHNVRHPYQSALPLNALLCVVV